ncbi:hypothetical protein SAMN05216503_1512 [Polaribacter sp. KT25b]|uniref:hypothetical protein n=1 Tax=Polaribacter sp. KT25b TaxID=1855336 RepID=UPI00087C0C97|nr:hypothetical protein [Polaribacter sp. KT25b]SDR95741.1 hypothetical protein SAMN05216503_1512 [Polaribacter sp. KT25b]
MNINLNKIERIKNYLVFKYSGICGIGSIGNSDVVKILENSKKEIESEKGIQGIIYDFNDLRYEFGNKFSELLSFDKQNKKLFVRIIPNKSDLNNWKSLQVNCSQNRNIELFQTNIKNAINSINSEMNNSNKEITLKEYNLFCKYGSELLWVSDKLRFKRPKDTNKETDEMFILLEKLDQYLEIISLGTYNSELIEQYKNEIVLLKGKVSKEVFEIIRGKYKTPHNTV